MQKEHDERAKLIAEQALDFFGEVQREVEIPASDALRIDLWLRRLLRPTEVPSHLRLLDALFPGDCMVEAFCQAVSLRSFWESHRKQYAWRNHLERSRPRVEGAEERAVLTPPFLWVLSAGRPDALMDRYAPTPRPGFPAGVYEVGRGFDVGLVVIAELPGGKETLLLRLMGAAAARREALAELRALPRTDPELPTLLRLLAALRHTFSRATTLSEEEKEDFVTAAWAEFLQYEDGIRKEGHKEGHKEGRKEGHKEGRKEGHKEGRKEGEERRLRQSLRDLCLVLQIEVTEERARTLATLQLPALEALRQQLLDHKAWPAAR